MLRYHFIVKLCSLMLVTFMLQGSGLMDRSCYGVVDRIEDDTKQVILLEAEKREIILDAREFPLQEGDFITLKRDDSNQCFPIMEQDFTSRPD